MDVLDSVGSKARVFLKSICDVPVSLQIWAGGSAEKINLFAIYSNDRRLGLQRYSADIEDLDIAGQAW